MTKQINNSTSTNSGYPKSYRLLTPAHFKYVFDKPERKIHATHIMAFIRNSDLDYPRLGMAITKKKVPTAVARNQLKRITRENFRLLSDNLKKTDIVFIAKRPITGLSNADLHEEVLHILNKIKLPLPHYTITPTIIAP